MYYHAQMKANSRYRHDPDVHKYDFAVLSNAGGRFKLILQKSSRALTLSDPDLFTFAHFTSLVLTDL